MDGPQKLRHCIPIPNHQKASASAILDFTNSIHLRRLRTESHKLSLTQTEQLKLRQLTFDVCVSLLYYKCAPLDYVASILDVVPAMQLWALNNVPVHAMQVSSILASHSWMMKLVSMQVVLGIYRAGWKLESYCNILKSLFGDAPKQLVACPPEGASPKDNLVNGDCDDDMVNGFNDEEGEETLDELQETLLCMDLSSSPGCGVQSSCDDITG
jgi:hypothetical protein